MLAFWSCEGVVFLVHSPSSHFTADHVFSLPLSGVNWRSLSLLWGSGPPPLKMAALSTGSAHTPSLGSNTDTNLRRDVEHTPMRHIRVHLQKVGPNKINTLLWVLCSLKGWQCLNSLLAFSLRMSAGIFLCNCLLELRSRALLLESFLGPPSWIALLDYSLGLLSWTVLLYSYLLEYSLG